MGSDIDGAGPDPFMHRESSTDRQHFYTTCADKVLLRASDDSTNNDVSAEDNETDGEGPEDSPYEVDLNRIPLMLERSTCGTSE